MSLLDINSEIFFLGKMLSTADIYNFPTKLELPKFILLVTISLILPAVSGEEMKIFRDQRRLTFLSHIVALLLYFALAAKPHMLVLQHKPDRVEADHEANNFYQQLPTFNNHEDIKNNISFTATFVLTVNVWSCVP